VLLYKGCSNLINGEALISVCLFLALKMEVEGASVVRIARKSSIESEPRTLGIHQIQYARVIKFFYINAFAN
jgi:hypothetical protein